MAKASGDDDIKELARLVVSQVAPEELPMFSVLAEASLADPVRMSKSRDDVRERLGFGVGEVAVLITPVAILAAGAVMQYLTGVALEAGISAARRIIAREAKGPGQQGDEERLDLRTDQLAELRRIVLDKALQGGVEPAQAELIANAFVGSVVDRLGQR